MLPHIDIQKHEGRSIKTYLPSIAKLRVDVFKEPPFCFEWDMKHELFNLRRLLCKEGIAILVFDKTKLVGAATGLPLQEAPLPILKPFQDQGVHVEKYFFFGQSILLPPYRGRGLYNHFFALREQHVLHLKKYTHICFSQMILAEQRESFSLDNFWHKRGYALQPKFVSSMENKRCELAFWVKNLEAIPAESALVALR